MGAIVRENDDGDFAEARLPRRRGRVARDRVAHESDRRNATFAGRRDDRWGFDSGHDVT